MPTLVERINEDYKTAFKAGERIRIDTLRLVKAGIQKVAMDKRKDTLDDQEVIAVLSMQLTGQTATHTSQPVQLSGLMIAFGRPLRGAGAAINYLANCSETMRLTILPSAAPAVLPITNFMTGP